MLPAVIIIPDETNNNAAMNVAAIDLRGGVVINKNGYDGILEALEEVEKMEKDICNLPLVFSEIFKDEINATEENDIYNAVKNIIRKYSGNKEALSILNEFTGAISGGASLEELLLIARDEAVNPTPATSLPVDASCKIDTDVH